MYAPVLDDAMQLSSPREDLRPWFVALRDLDGPLDWSAYFGNGHPVEIDVGAGRGLFLYNESLAHPERNFVGVEIDFREGRRAATRLKKRRAANARVLGGDVHEAFTKVVPAGSVAVVHVYCPDPWWKRKHRRRRVFTDAFVDEAARVLEPGGILSAASDVGEYFEIIRALMDHDPRFESAAVPAVIPGHAAGFRTSFEKKALAKGVTIHRGRWTFRGTALRDGAVSSKDRCGDDGLDCLAVARPSG